MRLIIARPGNSSSKGGSNDLQPSGANRLDRDRGHYSCGPCLKRRIGAIRDLFRELRLDGCRRNGAAFGVAGLFHSRREQHLD
jgi:hypothetical protein